MTRATPGLLALLLCCPAAFAQGAPEGPLFVVHQTAAPPLVDGHAEELWKDAQAVPLTLQLFGSVASDSDLAARFYALWTAEALFLLYRVQDETVMADSDLQYEADDAIEFYLDAGNEGGLQYGANDALYMFSFAYEEYGYLAPSDKREGVEVGMARTDSGYIMEVKLPWHLFGTRPTVGAAMRMAAIVDDDDDGNGVDARVASHFIPLEGLPIPDHFAPAMLAGPAISNTLSN